MAKLDESNENMNRTQEYMALQTQKINQAKTFKLINQIKYNCTLDTHDEHFLVSDFRHNFLTSLDQSTENMNRTQEYLARETQALGSCCTLYTAHNSKHIHTAEHANIWQHFVCARRGALSAKIWSK